MGELIIMSEVFFPFFSFEVKEEVAALRLSSMSFCNFWATTERPGYLKVYRQLLHTPTNMEEEIEEGKEGAGEKRRQR